MAINDYLQGINNATAGQTADVNTASNDLSELQIGEGSLPSKLKDALNTKLNNNADLINQQADTMQNYFNSGAQARAKYQDVWNPFEKAKLVQQDRSMALRPYDTLSGVLENRMGEVSDIVDSGVQGWQGMVNAATTRLGTAKDMLSTALSSYLSAAEQQQAADDMAFKIAQAEEASRQFEQTYGLNVKQFDEGVRQFNVSEANKLRIAGMSGSGSGGALTNKDKIANTKEMQDELRKVISEKGVSAGWAYISGSESSLAKYGVDANDLWSIYTAQGGSSVPLANTTNTSNKVTYGVGNDTLTNEQKRNLLTYGSTEALAWNDAKQTWTPGGK